MPGIDGAPETETAAPCALERHKNPFPVFHDPLFLAPLPFNFDGGRFPYHALDCFYRSLIGIKDHLVRFSQNVQPNAESIPDLHSFFIDDIEPLIPCQFRFTAIRLEQDDKIRIARFTAQEEELFFPGPRYWREYSNP